MVHQELRAPVEHQARVALALQVDRLAHLELQEPVVAQEHLEQQV